MTPIGRFEKVLNLFLQLKYYSDSFLRFLDRCLYRCDWNTASRFCNMIHFSIYCRPFFFHMIFKLMDLSR